MDRSHYLEDGPPLCTWLVKEVMENPTNMDDWGLPYFWKHPFLAWGFITVGMPFELLMSDSYILGGSTHPGTNSGKSVKV